MRKVALFVIVLMVSLPLVSSLQISGVSASEVTDKSAFVSWETDQLADSVVSFLSGNESFSVKDDKLVLQHSLLMSPLVSDSDYSFVVSSSVNDSKQEVNGSFSTASEDTFPPFIKADIPEFVSSRRISFRVFSEPGSRVSLRVNDILTASKVSSTGIFSFTNLPLIPEKENVIVVESTDSVGQSSSKTFNVFVDLFRPKINLVTPSVTSNASFVLEGNVSEFTFIDVKLENVSVATFNGTVFSAKLDLQEGINHLRVSAVDRAGNEAVELRGLDLDTTPPEIDEIDPLSEKPFYLEGRARDAVRGTTEPNSVVYLFVQRFSTDSEPDLLTIINSSQYKTVSDGSGFFEFDDVNFERPGGFSISAPREVAPGTVTGLELDEFKTESRTVIVHLAVVDEVGLSARERFQVDVGNCFSEFFEFSVSPLPAFQSPSFLSPDRLASGTETLSFVMELQRKDGLPNIKNESKVVPDDYYQVNGVTMSPACQVGFGRVFDSDKGYELGCQLIEGSANIVRPINAQRTKWFFRYDLKNTDEFLDFDKNLAEALANKELKFPFKLRIDFDEKKRGETSIKQQTLCRDVDYAVDVPVDPRKVLPDSLLENTRAGIEQTIKNIEKLEPQLDSAIQFTGIGCLGSIGIRIITHIWRRFAQFWELRQCDVLSELSEAKCKVKGVEDLEKNWYVGEVNPKPSSRSMKPLSEDEHFSWTLRAWQAEDVTYQASRLLCDRVFCNSAPAGWTQEKSRQDIRIVRQSEALCGADASQYRTLVPIKNCYEELKKSKSIDGQLVTTRDDLKKGDFKCYRMQNAIYSVDKLPNEGERCGNSAELKRIDVNREEIPVRNRYKQDETPNLLCAIKKGNVYYTAQAAKCDEVCESVSGWQRAGTEKRDNAFNTWCTTAKALGNNRNLFYAAGATSDCWIGMDNADSKRVDKENQCWCEPKPEKKKDNGAPVAGLENGFPASGVVSGESPGEWPWSYRQSRIFKSSNGVSGIEYPKERYYSGRDFPVAFGQNHLFDYLFNEKTVTTIDPRNQYLGPYQSLCLTGIRAQMNVIKQYLAGINGCLQQIQESGRADAGVCKELFSQSVCNLASKVFTWVENGCVPVPFTKGINFATPGQAKVGGTLGDIKDVVAGGTSAITNGINDVTSDLMDDYGNAKLDSMLEGGTNALVKRVCLAAFGIDAGFSFNDFLDAAYSVPFKTSVGLFSSEGSGGRREFLSFNPATTNSLYEYRTAWTIFPGCDIESYDIDLVAVTEADRRKYPSMINCAAVNNYEPGSIGCDNLRGSREENRGFFSGGRLTQGVYIDENSADVIEDSRRFDHFKVTLRLDPKWDADTCFPEENRVGSSTGVFYFPITDVTGKDVLQCTVQPDQGKFICDIGGPGVEGNAWIDSVQCRQPSGEFDDCEKVIYSVEDKEEIQARVNVFSSGAPLCLKANVKPARTSDTVPPELSTLLRRVLGVGSPATIPVDIKFPANTVSEENFKGSPLISVGQPCRVTPISSKDRGPLKDSVSDDRFIFIGSDDGFKLEVPESVDVDEGFGKDNSDFLVKNNKKVFTRREISNVVFRIGGYAFTNLDIIQREKIPKENERLSCSVSLNALSETEADQNWKLLLQLKRPNEQGACDVHSSTDVLDVPGLGFQPKEEVDLQVVKTRAQAPDRAFFDAGVKAYREALNGLANAEYDFAAASFEDAAKSLNQIRSRDTFEVHATFWAVAALVRAHDLYKSGGKAVDSDRDAFVKRRLKSLIAAFADTYSQSLNAGGFKAVGFSQKPADFAIVSSILSEINNKLSLNVQKITKGKTSSKKCSTNVDDCSKIEQEWAGKPLIPSSSTISKLIKGDKKYFNNSGEKQNTSFFSVFKENIENNQNETIKKREVVKVINSTKAYFKSAGLYANDDFGPDPEQNSAQFFCKGVYGVDCKLEGGECDSIIKAWDKDLVTPEWTSDFDDKGCLVTAVEYNFLTQDECALWAVNEEALIDDRTYNRVNKNSGIIAGSNEVLNLLQHSWRSAEKDPGSYLCVNTKDEGWRWVRCTEDTANQIVTSKKNVTYTCLNNKKNRNDQFWKKKEGDKSTYIAGS